MPDHDRGDSWTLSHLLSSIGELLGGFAILFVFLIAGIGIKRVLHLMVPGNVLGLFLLLAAIGSGVIKVNAFELASKCLLFCMPLLFVPLYVEAGAEKTIWAQWGWLLISSLAFAVLVMWVFVGHLAQWILPNRPETSSEANNP